MKDPAAVPGAPEGKQAAGLRQQALGWGCGKGLARPGLMGLGGAFCSISKASTGSPQVS